MRIEQNVVILVDELNSILSYMFIAESTHCSKFKTSKVQRKLAEKFTPDEVIMIGKISVKSNKWYLKSLPQEDVVMSMDEYNLWNKLIKFCYENL